MKNNYKQITIILLIVFLISCNLIMWFKIKEPPKGYLQGTYQHKNEYTYILFDKTGKYCQYSQIEGILSEGDYKHIGNECYVLENNTGEINYIVCNSVQNRREIEYINISSDIKIVYSKIAAHYLLFDNPDSEEWPNWCLGI